MNRRVLPFLLLLFLVPALACGGQETPATMAPPAAVTSPPAAATAVPSPLAPTEAAVPPAQTPTIVIPTAAAQPPEAGPTLPPPPPVTLPQELLFAAYRQADASYTPAVFHDPIAADLSNVTVPFVLSPEQRDRLAQDGLVVSPGVEKEFFTVYEQARYNNLPVFVTSDSLLHVYHLLFDKVLRTAERESFAPLLVQLNETMLAQTDAQYQALLGTPWEEAARYSVAFIAVGSRLLDPTAETPAYVEELVAAELARIEAAEGIQPSAVFPGLEFGEDYTQYIPRGHYTTHEDLVAYFKCMMWYGRMTFRLKTDNRDVGRAETRSALLLVQALRSAQVGGRPALEAWLDLYNPTSFLVGRSDDLTAFQYLEVIDEVYGSTPALTTIADESLLDTFIETADQLPPPRILGLVISAADDVEETTKGFRFMGQRFVPDAYIFRELIYRNVGDQGNPRMLPMGLDVMAAMGSERAYTILDELGETEYAGYPEQMDKMQLWVGGLTTEQWTETLYTTWLYTFQPLLAEPAAPGYPQFMQSDAWLDKQLNTSLGSWAELKHDTILYAKQVYAELGGGGDMPRPLPARGYVEPVPEFYARLEALTAMTLAGMDERGLLNDQDRNSLYRLQQLVLSMQEIAIQELQGEPLSDSQYNLIRFYGGELEHLTMAAADREDADPNAQPYMEEEPQAAVIADVATAPDPDGDGAPNPVVLEEAVGRINEIYVVAPLINSDGTVELQVAKGGVFAYYEFPWPADDRLTDEKWRAMLDEGTAPPLPEWTDSFFTMATEYAAFQRAIYGFQLALTEAYWLLESTYMYNASPEVQDQLTAEFDLLRQDDHFIGHQWVTAGYRSFDIQAEDKVVVTVRERWQDALYLLSEYPAGEPVARRGPYSLDVTYTLEQRDGRWLVTNVVYANEPPGWE